MGHSVYVSLCEEIICFFYVIFESPPYYRIMLHFHLLLIILIIRIDRSKTSVAGLKGSRQPQSTAAAEPYDDVGIHRLRYTDKAVIISDIIILAYGNNYCYKTSRE